MAPMKNIQYPLAAAVPFAGCDVPTAQTKKFKISPQNAFLRSKFIDFWISRRGARGLPPPAHFGTCGP